MILCGDCSTESSYTSRLSLYSTVIGFCNSLACTYLLIYIGSLYTSRNILNSNQPIHRHSIVCASWSNISNDDRRGGKVKNKRVHHNKNKQQCIRRGYDDDEWPTVHNTTCIYEYVCSAWMIRGPCIIVYKHAVFKKSRSACAAIHDLSIAVVVVGDVCIYMCIRPMLFRFLFALLCV